MKPYPDKSLDDKRRIFNYRLSRFRRVSENGFGIWSNRFRNTIDTIGLDPAVVSIVVKASCALHNMHCTKSRESYAPQGYTDETPAEGTVIEGTWRNDTVELVALQTQNRENNTKRGAEIIRGNFTAYFYGPGQVSWKWKTL